MKTVVVPKNKKIINTLLDQARRQNLVLRAADGAEFILAEIDDFDREIELTRQNKKLMGFLDRRARQTETISLAEARRQLGLE